MGLVTFVTRCIPVRGEHELMLYMTGVRNRVPNLALRLPLAWLLNSVVHILSTDWSGGP